VCFVLTDNWYRDVTLRRVTKATIRVYDFKAECILHLVNTRWSSENAASKTVVGIKQRFEHKPAFEMQITLLGTESLILKEPAQRFDSGHRNFFDKKRPRKEVVFVFGGDGWN
jgi:hypothetical protein